MKLRIIFVLFLQILVVQFSISQSGWFRLFTLQGTTSCTGMQFFGSETGYITSRYGDAHNNGGGVQKTTNGGVNWIFLQGGVNRYGLSFLNEQTGWVIGGYWDDAGTISREVFRTTNGGANFTRLYIDSVLTSFNKVFFKDFNTGWIITYNQLLKTTNSGINWSECAPLSFTNLYFINSNTGWACASGGIVYKTINGGLNWASYSVSPSSYLVEIYFIDNNTGWISSSSPYIYKSTNSGVNWIAYSTGLTDWTSSIEFYDHTRGWASSDSGKILTTTNGGVNWTIHATGEFHDLSNLCFQTANTGYVFGRKFLTPYSHEFILMKTTNGGLIGFRETSTEIPISFELHQNYPNPFNPKTIINFQLPIFSNVKLIVYDILGREFATLVNEQLKPGSYEVEWDASNYPSGIYFYKLATGSFTETKRMVLIK